MDAGERIAGAPISWGVCEAPDWGFELPVARVLGEMQMLGLAGTELGPAGYLGAEPADVVAKLRRHDLRLAGGFVAAVLHRPDVLATQMQVIEESARALAAAGADVLVLAIAASAGAYDQRIAATIEEWECIAASIVLVEALASRHGLRVALHPHVGTLVERDEDLRQLLDRSPVALCIDTGHMQMGGIDVLALVTQMPERIAHVHLKDVNAQLAAQVASGDLGFARAVKDGLFLPLGDGDARVSDVVAALEDGGYDGWYVLEQDARLDEEPPVNVGPQIDARRSIDRLRGWLAESRRARP